MRASTEALRPRSDMSGSKEDQAQSKHKVHRGKCLIRRGTHSPEIKGKGPKLDQHERHVRTRGKDERKQSATRHNNNTTTTPTHELRRKRYSNSLNHPTHPTLEYRLPSNYARRALLVYRWTTMWKARKRYGSYKAERTLVTGTKRTWPSYLRCSDGTTDVI